MKNLFNLLLLFTLGPASLFCAENQQLGFWQKTQQKGSAAHQMNSKAITSSDFLDKMNYINNLDKTSINDLPNDMLNNIFSFLPEKDLLKQRQVCKKWKERVDAPTEDSALKSIETMHIKTLGTNMRQENLFETSLKDIKRELYDSNYPKDEKLQEYLKNNPENISWPIIKLKLAKTRQNLERDCLIENYQYLADENKKYLKEIPLALIVSSTLAFGGLTGFASLYSMCQQNPDFISLFIAKITITPLTFGTVGGFLMLKDCICAFPKYFFIWKKYQSKLEELKKSK